MTNIKKAIYALMGCSLLFLLTAGQAKATICPSTGFTNTDCGFIVTINSNGTITGAAVAGANPYEGADDQLIGVVNNSSSTFTGSFVISSSGGSPIFGFDGDGICSFLGGGSSCLTGGKFGYEGPLNTFSGISAGLDSGTVNITGLGAGATTYFSLELAPTGANGGGIVVGGTPEPSTILLLGTGLVGLALRRFMA